MASKKEWKRRYRGARWSQRYLLNEVDRLGAAIHDVWLTGTKEERAWAEDVLELDAEGMIALGKVRQLEVRL